MLTIGIEPADNGVIKTLVDDNVNGGGEEFESRQVYEFEGPMKRANQIKFFKDLVFDLGLDIGTELDPDRIRIALDWGSQYEPTDSEIKKKIQTLEREIKRLNSILDI
jgi:hypothetical protein